MNFLVTQAWQTAILLALFAVWAVLLFGGFALGPDHQSIAPGVCLPGPAWVLLLILVVIAWLWYAFTRQSPVGTYALLIAVGMSCGCLGDLFLASVIPLREPVLAGMLAFGLGHVAYLVAAILLGNHFRLGAPLPRFSMLTLWLLIGLAGWYVVILRGHKPRHFALGSPALRSTAGQCGRAFQRTSAPVSSLPARGARSCSVPGKRPHPGQSALQRQNLSTGRRYRLADLRAGSGADCSQCGWCATGGAPHSLDRKTVHYRSQTLHLRRHAGNHT